MYLHIVVVDADNVRIIYELKDKKKRKKEREKEKTVYILNK